MMIWRSNNKKAAGTVFSLFIGKLTGRSKTRPTSKTARPDQKPAERQSIEKPDSVSLAR